MTTALAVAQTFLDMAEQEGRRLTNMHLQKLVFFAHGVHLAAFDGEPLIEESVRAWDFGPVIPPLYERLRRFGSGTVDVSLAPNTRDRLDPTGHEMQAIRSVWNAYKSYDGWSLSKISHVKGGPWDVVWNSQGNRYGDIPNELIRTYYSSRVKPAPGSAIGNS